MRPARLLLTSLLLAIPFAPALAAWGPEPLLVAPGTGYQSLRGAPDGAGGVFLLWQEPVDVTTGALRLQHLTAGGELDPAWPVEGAVACSVLTARTSTWLAPDGSGGIFAAWTEGLRYFARHLPGDGSVDSRWPARGLELATSAVYPCFVGDGSGGFHAAWSTGNSSGATLYVTHLGADAGPAPGWPAEAQSLPLPLSVVFALDLAGAPGGGAYLSWMGLSVDTVQVPWGHRTIRYEGDGGIAPGWPASGVLVAPLDDYRFTNSDKTPLASAPDGSGGLLLLDSEPGGYGSYGRLRRLLADGTFAPGWNPVLDPGGAAPFWFPEARYGPRLFATPDGGALLVFAGLFFTDSPPDVEAYRFSANGDLVSEWWLGKGGWFDVVLDPVAGYHSIVAQPSQSPGFQGYMTPELRARSAAALAPGFAAQLELGGPDLLYAYNFAPVAITPVGGGQAVAAWAGRYTNPGLRAGLVGALSYAAVADGAAPGTARWSASFRRGDGVRARIPADDERGMRLELLDVAGRRLSSAALDACPCDFTLPGSRDLAPGLYFVRLRGSAGAETVKLAVLR